MQAALEFDTLYERKAGHVFNSVGDKWYKRGHIEEAIQLDLVRVSQKPRSNCINLWPGVICYTANKWHERGFSQIAHELNKLYEEELNKKLEKNTHVIGVDTVIESIQMLIQCDAPHLAEKLATKMLDYWISQDNITDVYKKMLIAVRINSEHHY